MALISEGQEYSSPSKRIKLDQAQHLSNSNVELDFGAFTAPLKNVYEGVEGEYSVNAEIMNSGDSGFNEMGSATSNMKSSEPNTPTLDISANSSKRCDDGGTRDDDRDEVSSTVSYLSDISGLSDLSGQEWKPMAGPMSWIQRQMITGVNPRNLLNQLVTDGTQIPPQMDDLTLWKIIVNMMSEPPRRQKLRHINTLTDVVRLLKGAKKIIVLTGAGVSVSCGIPDFRSRDGIYSRLAIDFPDLPDPQAMFDIQYFSQDPRPFFKFAREIYPGQFKPSPCHRFIKILEKHKKLLRNYSQNIDTLEQVAGIENVIECHGSFATASCTRCKHKVTADEIREDIFEQRIPLCTLCPKGTLPRMNENEDKYESYRDLVSQGIMKPDIVFFGEGLPEIFHESMAKDKDECDLLIVIGSSLKVRPVALIPSSIPPEVPQILINREPLPHFNFDVELLGDSDIIINQLCHMMSDDWREGCCLPSPLTEASHLLPQMSRHKEKERDRDSGQGADCSSQDSVVNRSASSRSTAERMMNIETSEAESLQMSIDSGVSISTADSSCNLPKERHISVDSSTLDSGVGLSADSPTDSYRSSGQFYTTGDSTKALGVCETGKVCGESGCESIAKERAAGSFIVNSFISNKNSSIVVDSASTRQNASEITAEKLSLNRNCDTHRHMSTDFLHNLGDSCNSNDESTKEHRLSVDSSDEHPKSEEDLEILRACWQSKIRESLASRLPEGSYYHLTPNRYIFPGAEVYYEPDDMEQSSYSSSSSSEPSDSANNSSAEDSDNEDVEEGEFWDEEGVMVPEC